MPEADSQIHSASSLSGAIFPSLLAAGRRSAAFGLASALAIISTVTMAPPAAAASCVAAASTLTAWWKLDTISFGSTPELMAQNHAELQGNPQLELLGQVGPAMSFDGNDYLAAQDCQHLDIGTADFSILAWVRTSSQLGSFGTVVSKRETVSLNVVGYQFQLNNGRLLLQIGDPASGHLNFWATSLPTVSDGQWHLVAASVDRDSPTGLRLYLDGGTPQAFNPTSRQGNLANNSELRIGRATSAGPLDDYFDGEIDEVQIYKRALSQTEIQAIFNARSSGVCKKRLPTLQSCDEGDPT